MKRFLKILFAVAAAFAIALGNPMTTRASAISPENIRVGLNYKATALSSFNISAEKGLQVGYVKEGKFYTLYDEAGLSPVTVRKDGYYSVNVGSYTEFVPNKQGTVLGLKFGPYHIKIGGSYNDYTTAAGQVLSLKQKGVTAYPVFTDGWQIWAGFYLNEADAQADISNTMLKKLGNIEFNVIREAPTRLVVQKSTGEVALVYDEILGAMQIQPKTDNNPYAFTLNSKGKYRGALEVRRFTGSDITLINVIPFDQYLYGVVPSEMESYSNQEALKAQAVVSRTYTINSMGKHNDNEFDLCSTTHCQVYKGLNAEVQGTNEAIDETKGKLILYNGKPASVFYFASSGGWTENSENVWTAVLPYLKGVEDKYELTTSSHYYWENTFTPAKVNSLLLSKGIDVGNVLGINVKKYTESGRVLELEIIGSKKSHTLTKQATRMTFGLNSQMYKVFSGSGISVKSGSDSSVSTGINGKSVITAAGIKTSSANGSVTVASAQGNKTVSISPEGFTFKGQGWGHGVGMSQEGAKGMADSGFKYDAILQHYFQGTTIE